MNTFISTFLILASIGIFWGYVNPTYREITGSADYKEKSIVELREEKDRYDDAISKVREIELVRTGLLEKYNAINDEDKDRLVKFLPDHVDSVRLIIDVNSIASKHKMVLKNIALVEVIESTGIESDMSGKGDFSPVEFRFTVSGPYDSLRAFLTDLEQSLRLIDIQSLVFKAGGETDYDYQVTIYTYRLN